MISTAGSAHRDAHADARRRAQPLGTPSDEHGFHPDEAAWFRHPRDEAGREFDPDSGAIRIAD